MVRILGGDFLPWTCRKKIPDGKCSDEIQMRRKWFWKALSCRTSEAPMSWVATLIAAVGFSRLYIGLFEIILSFLSFPSFPRKMRWSSQRRLLLRSSLAGKPSYSYCQEAYSLETLVLKLVQCEHVHLIWHMINKTSCFAVFLVCLEHTSQWTLRFASFTGTFLPPLMLHEDGMKVSEDVHVLDKELLTQEIKEILRWAA